MAYLRYDGMNLLLLDPDTELPLSIWNSSASGTVNPSKILANKEVKIMDVYNADWAMSFKDIPNNTIVMKPVAAYEYTLDTFGKSWLDRYGIRQTVTYEWLKKLTLGDDITVFEGIGTIGDLAHSLAYPSIQTMTDGAAIQKLIRVAGAWEMKQFTPSEATPDHPAYEDAELYAAYKDWVTAVETVEADFQPSESGKYDLQGHPLSETPRGEPYIHNGRIHIKH